MPLFRVKFLRKVGSGAAQVVEGHLQQYLLSAPSKRHVEVKCLFPASVCLSVHLFRLINTQIVIVVSA